MLPRYLDVFVLSNAHYYDDTPLLMAMKHNRAIRQVSVERFSTNPIDSVNTVFLDPSVFSYNGKCGFDQVLELIESVRKKYPNIVFVLCSTADIIRDFIVATGDRFTHYLQLDYDSIGSAPDRLVDKVIQACQVEVARNIRTRFEYDIALSFAGEQREHAESIAKRLKANGATVFYDDFEKADLWGRDLYAHLHDVYSTKSHFCILLASAAYAQKVWTSHERQAAQERALHEKGAPYILPVRCDDTNIPGLSKNIAYLKVEEGAVAICDCALDKMGVVKI